MVAFQRAVACNIWTHNWKVMGFWRFQSKFGHALSHCECSILPKIAKICQNLPKDEIPPKIEILVFFKKKKLLRVEEALEHASTIRIFNPRIFHILFVLSKNSLCMWILVYPFVENIFFGNLPQLWWIWDSAHMYLTQVGTRVWSPVSHIYIQKWFFGPQNTVVPLRHSGKKLFLWLWTLWSHKR
jgi:hypothetical protein